MKPIFKNKQEVLDCDVCLEYLLLVMWPHIFFIIMLIVIKIVTIQKVGFVLFFPLDLGFFS